MKYFNQYGIDVGYVIMGMAAVILIMFILLIVTMAKDSGTRKKYRQFMAGEDGKNLETAILDKFSSIDTLEENVKDLYSQIKRIDEILVTTYQKVGIVKYDAFQEIGGKLSFAITLLTAENNGFVINSVHSSREGCYTYIKQITNGQSSIPMSEEETESLKMAMGESV